MGDHTWLRRGADGDRRYVGFLDAVEKAQSEADLRDLKTIREAAQAGVWQAAAWRLERRHPQQWGRRRVEMTGAEGGPVDVEVREMTVLDLVRLACEADEACCDCRRFRCGPQTSALGAVDGVQ